jgi:anaerobic selenocysteine-containing dehydrogenase
MEDFLKSPVAPVVAGLALVLILAKVAAWLFSRKKTAPYSVRVRCLSCGWQGSVGKYNRRCSACNSTVVESLKG